MDQPKPIPFRKPGTFPPGHTPTVRRAKGVRNRITRDIKEGLINSAVKHGSDGKGTDGLEGYFDFLLVADLRMHAQLMGKLIPYMVNANVSAIATTINVVPVPHDRYVSAEDAVRSHQALPLVIDKADDVVVIDNDNAPALVVDNDDTGTDGDAA